MNNASQQPWIDAAIDNVLAGKPVENISLSQPNISTAEAYALQRELVKGLRENQGWGGVCGYKAALTAAPAQQAMGVHEPVIGVLFDHGAHSAGAEGSLAIKADRPVLLETELGFTLGEAIDAPVTATSIQTKVRHCQGMIELAAPNLQQRASGVDLISSNSASYGFITAAITTDPAGIGVDDLQVSLTRLGTESETLHRFAAGTVMTGQWQALAWLVNSVLAQGYDLQAGHLLMTGSIGSMHPGTPGQYLADFGELGRLDFRL